MKTVILKINSAKPDIKRLQKAVEVLKNGGVVVFPTDTVYGLASSAFDNEARKRIYKLKGRNYNKPLIVMAGNVKALSCLFALNEKISKIMNTFWPGPLTLVLPATNIGKIVMGGRDNVGIRIPNDKTALALLKLCDFPLATTSANPSSKSSAKSFKEAFTYFNGKVDLIIDSGKCLAGKESTVLDMTHFPYTVIRHGCLDKKEIIKIVDSR